MTSVETIERGLDAARLRRVRQRLKDRDLLVGIYAICGAKHATLFDVVGFSRSKSVVAARHASWLACFAAGLSQQEVATIFERTLDTVAHAAGYRETRKAQTRRAAEDEVVKKVAAWLFEAGVHAKIVEELLRGAWRGELGTAIMTKGEGRRRWW